MNIVYFVTEDSYFLSHRLPVAINAQKLGHKVFIVTKLTGKESLIESYGFEIVPTYYDFVFTPLTEKTMFNFLASLSTNFGVLTIGP